MSMSDISVTSGKGAICLCGLYTEEKSSFSYKNPGKTYLGCPRLGSEGACRFFRWVDTEVSEKLTYVMRKMLERVQEREGEIKNLKHLIEKKEIEMECLKTEIKALRNERNLVQLKGKNLERKVSHLKAKADSRMNVWICFGCLLLLALVLGLFNKRVDSRMLSLKGDL